MAESLAGAASIYVLDGDFESAETLYKRALDIRQSILGEYHPETVRTMEALAEVYYKLNKPAEAEKLEERALDIRTRKR